MLYKVRMNITCADPGIFVRGGGGGGVQVNLTKISSDNVFFFFHFSRFQGGPTFSRGGGGVQLLIPYRNPYNL